ncbi:MAG: FAD-dependent oxidoreductase [Nitriliruptorales bacterium]|nr:FAD-dependent oxidoreductase [Nitriliruptorales bacterium]
MAGDRYDVVIVGGGMGGLNLAALLVTAGKRVLVLERGPREALGGRAASGKRGSAAIDNGIKGLIMMGAQDEIHRRIGRPLPENVCEWTNPGKIFVDGEWLDLEALIMRNVQDFIEVYKSTAQEMTYEQIAGLNDISIEQFVRERTDNPEIIAFFNYLGWLFGGTLPQATDYSAGSLFYSIKAQVDATGEMPMLSYWVKGGSGSIATGLIEAIEEGGGEIRAGATVSHVVIENGRAVGVEVEVGDRFVPTQLRDTERIEASAVVSAVAIWDLFSIVSRDDLAPWYAERLEYLHRKTLNVATLTYGFADAEVDWDDSGARWVDVGPYTGKPWCASSLRFDEEEGRNEVSFWMQLGWWEKPNLHDLRQASHKVALRRLFDDWERDIAFHFPSVAERKTFKVRSFGPATIIETPGMVGETLVDIKAEGVEGLWLVGERTREAKVMGVYGSAQTALAASERILAEV